MAENSNNRSPLVVAAEWGSRVTTIALEMALPPALGHWADQWLGTGVLLVALGGAVGLTTGTWHLIRMTSGLNRPAKPGDARRRPGEHPPSADKPSSSDHPPCDNPRDETRP